MSAPTRVRAARTDSPDAQLRQQETGIVDGLAQQRRAEAQRDAVHRAKPCAHGDDARSQAGNGRQKAQQDDRHRPIHPEQDAEDQHDRRDRQPRHIGRDQRPARNGHCSRARIAQSRAAVLSRRGEGAFNGGNRALLALEVPARRLRLGDEQRGVAVAREPDAIEALGLHRRCDPREDVQRLARRIVGQPALLQYAAAAGQPFQPLLQRGTQLGHLEMRSIDAIAQLIAITLDQRQFGRTERAFAVGHVAELGTFRQRARHALCSWRQVSPGHRSQVR